jgi:integrase
MSESKATPGPHKRIKTRHRGITYRVKADGSRTYYVYVAGRFLAVDGGEKEALAKQAELRGRRARGERAAPRPVRFQQVAEDWFESKRRLRPWTRKNYRSSLDRVLLPAFGNMKLGQITPEHVARLIRQLEQEGKAPGYIDNLLKPLGGTFKYAMRKQLVTMNPLVMLTPDDRPARMERERREWSPEDVAALLEASRRLAGKSTSRQDYSLLLETAIRTGLRLGELLGLQWRDIDLKQGVLSVRRQWTRDGTYSEPKTPAAIRQVPLASEMVTKLAEHKLASNYSSDEQPVFASATGQPLHHRNVAQRGFEAAAKEAGLLEEGQPRITFHDLRHAFASIMIECGLSSTVLARVMGHRDATTTERKYVHLFNRELITLTGAGGGELPTLTLLSSRPLRFGSVALSAGRGWCHDSVCPCLSCGCAHLAGFDAGGTAGHLAGGLCRP